jgi:predicted permease
VATVLIVAPVFALIAAGYAAVLFRFVSETANKGISEFAFSIAIPALLFRTVVVSEFPSVSAFSIWGAFYGALTLTWIAALLLSSVLRQEREDGPVFAIGAVYGNIVMLGIPLTLSALGSQAAGPMALIMCALKLLAMPAIAWMLAHFLQLPPTVAGVVVLFAAMPTGANAYIFAVQYRRLVNPVSGAVALGTMLAAVTLPLIVVLVTSAPR